MKTNQSNTQKFIDSLPVVKCPVCGADRAMQIGANGLRFIIKSQDEAEHLTANWQKMNPHALVPPFTMIPGETEGLGNDEKFGAYSEYGLMVSCHGFRMTLMGPGETFL